MCSVVLTIFILIIYWINFTQRTGSLSALNVLYNFTSFFNI